MKKLYHYTTVEALLSMLHLATPEEKETIEVNNQDTAYGYYLTFHATDAYMLNDKLEHKLLLESMCSIINKRKMYYDVETLACGKPYVVSFCRKGDYLPMWQIYAKNGKGICLEFEIDEQRDVDVLNRLNGTGPAAQQDELELVKCKYISKRELSNLKRKWPREIEKAYHEIPKNQISPKLPYKTLYQEAITYKTDDWKYEDEIRLVRWTQYPQIKNGKNGLCPYVEIKIPLRFLKGIQVGPSLNQEANVYAINELLRIKEIDKLKNPIKVTASKVALK